MFATAARTLSFGTVLLAALLASACADDPAEPPASVGGSSGAGGSGGAGSGGAAAGAGGAAAGAGGAMHSAGFLAVAEIMRQNCGAPACHGGGPDGQKLVYVNLDTLYATLTTTAVSECMGNFIVKPGEPANSALLKLPNWDCTDMSGGPFVMPQGCIDDPCLKPDELSTITQWIMAGAPP